MPYPAYFCRMDFEQDLEASLEVLRTGGLILYPTDTVWGVGCDATLPEAVARIYQLKQRAESKSMIVLVGAERDILRYTAGVDLSLFDYLKTVTRPTTVVYDGAIGLAPNLLAPDGSVGIRVVQDTFCRHLVKRLRKPIVSTSANISGRPAPGCFADIDPEIVLGVDYVVQYRQGDRIPREPSSVVRWGKDGHIEVIRP
jgi:L-threonylcarbamoyladenylate synthase